MMLVEQEVARGRVGSEHDGTLPDLDQVRALLRKRFDSNDAAVRAAVDRLDISYVKLTDNTEGQADTGALPPVSRLLFEGAGEDGSILYLSGLRVRHDKGERLAAELNCSWQRSAGRAATGSFYQAAFYEPDLGLLFQVFPLDRRLPSLPTAADGRALAPVLEALLVGGRIRRVAVRPMRYKPQRKCMFRYQITWESATAGPAVVYGKVARASTFSQTRDILRRVRAAAPGIEFSLPQSLGVVPELSMEFFSEVPGLPLAELIADDQFDAHCARAARALQQFHSLPVRMARRWDLTAKLPRLADDVSGLCRLFPSQAERIEALQREISDRLRASEIPSQYLIHRDFHGTNVLVDGERVGLIDLEDCAMGDPAEDLGSMCAYLYRLAAERPAQASALRRARGAFLDAYPKTGPCADADADAFDDRVSTHTALYCLFQAYQQLRHPHVGERYRNAGQLLSDGADALLGAAPG